MAGDPNQVNSTRSAVSLPLVVNANTDRIFENVKRLQNIAPEDEENLNTYTGGATPPGRFEHVHNTGIIVDKAVTNIQTKTFTGVGSGISRYVGQDGVAYSLYYDSGYLTLSNGYEAVQDPNSGSYNQIVHFFSKKYNNVVPSDGSTPSDLYFIGIYPSARNVYTIDKIDLSGNVVASRNITMSVVGSGHPNDVYLAANRQYLTTMIYDVYVSGTSVNFRLTNDEGATIFASGSFVGVSDGSGGTITPFSPGPLNVIWGSSTLVTPPMRNGNGVIRYSVDTFGVVTSFSTVGLCSDFKSGTTNVPCTWYSHINIFSTDAGFTSPTTATSLVQNTISLNGITATSVNGNTAVTGFPGGAFPTGTVITGSNSACTGVGDSFVYATALTRGMYSCGLTTSPQMVAFNANLYSSEQYVSSWSPGSGSGVSFNRPSILWPTVSNSTLQGFSFQGKPLPVEIGNISPSCSIFLDLTGSMRSFSIQTINDGFLFGILYDETITPPQEVSWYESDSFVKPSMTSPLVFYKTDRSIVLDISSWNGKGFVNYTSGSAVKKFATSPNQNPGFGYLDPGEHLSSASNSLVLYSPWDFRYPNPGINVFIDGEYSYTADSNYRHVDSLYSGFVYVPNQTIPLPGLINYSGSLSASSESTTYILGGYQGTQFDRSIDGYVIGNSIPIIGDSFSLFGSAYIFDGNNIYGVSIDNGAVSFPLEIITAGRGLTYLCNSPERAWFLSAYDNSIYVFDGGRSLRKWRAFNGFDTITRGVYSVRDESLLLDAGSDWIWMGDGIISSSPKEADQIGNASLRLYSTTGGIYVGDNSVIRAYGYKSANIPDLATSVTTTTGILPIDLQLPFYGFGNNKIGQFYRYAVAIWSETRAPVKITVTTYGFNQDGAKGFTNLNPVQRVVNVQTVDYDDSGYFRFSVDPAAQKGIASSLRIQSDDLISIYEVVLEYNDLGVQAIYAPGRKV